MLLRYYLKLGRSHPPCKPFIGYQLAEVYNLSRQGFLVLTGALELMSRNIVPGSVRLLYSVVYALFLGFGFSIGAELYELFTSHQVYGAEDYTCSLTHNPHGPWYQRTPSTWWGTLMGFIFLNFMGL